MRQTAGEAHCIESQPARAADNHCPATAETRQGRTAGPGTWPPSRPYGHPKPGAAENGQLQAGGGISGGGSRNRIAAIDAGWQIGQEVVEALLLAEKQRMKEHPLGVKYQEVVF